MSSRKNPLCPYTSTNRCSSKQEEHAKPKEQPKLKDQPEPEEQPEMVTREDSESESHLSDFIGFPVHRKNLLECECMA